MINSNNKFKVEIFNPNKLSWEDVKDRILFIEREEFGEKAFTEKQFSDDFQNKQSTVALLREDESNEIIGFTYAKPINELFLQRGSEKDDTVLIYDTVIQKKFRHNHLVGDLMRCLEQELIRKKFKYIERHARIANGYAENVSKFYKNRILEQRGPEDSEWGPQIYFRIKL